MNIVVFFYFLAAKNVEKLKLFREFYLLVVSYIYFTRIIVFLLDSTLFYSVTWISTFVSEFCTLFFFGITGYVILSLFFSMNSLICVLL